jgi:hypothetical protein
MKIMKRLKIVVLAAVLTVLCAAFAFAQAAPRSYYVRADGNDDNNGRSEEAAFKTMTKAVEAAKAGIIKRITVIGTITAPNSFTIEAAGTDEILITGKADAGDVEKAVITAYIFISGSKVRFTHIKLDVSHSPTSKGGIRVFNSTVTLDENTLVTDETAKKNRKSIGSVFGIGATGENEATLIMSGNAAIVCVDASHIMENTDDRGKSSLVMSGSAKISGSTEDGIYKITTVTMSGNAEISGNAGNGIYGYEGIYEQRYGDSLVTMSGNAQVSNNGKAGIYRASVTMSDSAKVTGNKGEGIRGVEDDTITLQGNAEVSANSLTGVHAKGPLTLSGSANVSNNKGGGVVIEGGILTINGGTISGNNGKNGGGVYVNGGTCSINDGTITANKAEYGAGVYINAGALAFKGGSITGNEAEFVGGGVYVKSGTTYTAGAGVVSGNTAGDGGANVFRQ